MVYPAYCQDIKIIMKTKKIKILFIEDEMRMHKLFRDIFEQEGMEFFTAYDGETGIKLAEEKMPDLVLLDLILPKKNGFEVLEEIKANPRLAKIPVIVLTNLEGAQDIEKALSLGAHTYLVKANYSIDEILKKIKETVEQNEK